MSRHGFRVQGVLGFRAYVPKPSQYPTWDYRANNSGCVGLNRG